MDIGNLIDDVLGVLRRRWIVILLPLCIGLPLTLTVALLLPSIYASTARILVESQQIPDELAQSTVPQSAAERIQLLQQRLLTRQNLLEIAEEYNVFANRPTLSPTETLAEMRRATSIDQNGRGRGRSVTGIDITFRAENPQLAAQVANEFVSRILTQNVEDRTNRATNTLAFFDQEVERLAREIDALSTQITQLKVENRDALPETLSAREAELANLRAETFNRLRERAALNEQKRQLEESLRIGRTSPGGRPSQAETELARLRNTLLQQQATLAPTHPTIRQLNARIDALENAIQPVASDTGDNSPGTGFATNLVAQIEAIELQIELIDNRRDAAEARVAELEESIARTPQIEMTLASLERNQQTLSAQYRNAILKQAQAETGERLEVTQQSERFEVIEQAIPEPDPVSPNRRLIVAMGFAATIGISGALTILLELLNNAIRTTRDLERQVALRPIISIPYLETEGERQRRRWKIRALLIAVAIAIPAGLLAVDQLFMPLPRLLEAVANRLQISQMLEPLGLSF